MFSGVHTGWKAKWKTTAEGKIRYYRGKDWYYFGYYPPYEEKFPYSSTILVCLTDSWHKYQFLFLRSIYVAIAVQGFGVVMTLIWGFLIFPLLYGLVFNPTFDRSRRKF